MKSVRTTSFSVSLLFVYAVLLAAQEPANFDDRLKQFDKNADSKLTKDELPDGLKPFFEKMDANKDGFVTTDEAAMFVGWGQRHSVLDRPQEQAVCRVHGADPGLPFPSLHRLPPNGERGGGEVTVTRIRQLPGKRDKTDDEGKHQTKVSVPGQTSDVWDVS